MTDAEPIDNRLFILILQHPREKKETLATAALTVGDAAAGRARGRAVLAEFGAGARPAGRSAALGGALSRLGAAADVRPDRDVVALDRHGEPAADQAAMLRDLDGAVLLDGSWSEAKALWWRNPWLLKLRRLVLDPQRPRITTGSAASPAARRCRRSKPRRAAEARSTAARRSKPR